MKEIVGVILVLALAACGTAPKVHNFERSRSFPVSKDEAWLNTLDFFTSNSVQVKTIEKDSGVIYAETMRFDPHFADCGDPGLTIPIQSVGEFNVFVRERGHETDVTVNTSYRQVRQFGQYPPFVVYCNSTGFMEQLVLESAGKSVGTLAAGRSTVQPSAGPAEPVSARSVQPTRVEANLSPPALSSRSAPTSAQQAVAVPAAVPPGDPCAQYQDAATASRCRLYAGPDGWQYIPVAGRGADLDTQLRCAPFRSSATSYERCISGPGE